MVRGNTPRKHTLSNFSFGSFRFYKVSLNSVLDDRFFLDFSCKYFRPHAKF